MKGMLHRGEIDIAPLDFVVTKSRASVVDYLPGIWPLYTQIFIRNPDASANWMAYLEPFTFPCWLAIMVVLIAAPMLIKSISFYGKYTR